MGNEQEIKTSLCPICGEENRCAKSEDPEAKECWCKNEIFPEGIFDLVPNTLLRKTCICRKCLQNYKKENNI